MKLKKLKPQFSALTVVLLVTIAVLIAADLVTKYLEEQFVWRATIIPNFIEIRSGIHNTGCAFSFLDSRPDIGQPLLITVTFLLLVVMIFGFIFIPNKFVIIKISIALIIAGAVGNLYDRLTQRSDTLLESYGYVRDWFGLKMFGRMTYCNFADFWIVIGAVLAVLDLLFLNEWAVFPLTKSAKAAQAARKEEEERQEAAEAEIAEDGEDEEAHSVGSDESAQTPDFSENTDNTDGNP